MPFNKKPAPPMRRRAASEGRAPTYTYHASRSVEPTTTSTKRQPFRTPLTAANASRVLRFSVRRIGIIVISVVACISLISILTLSSDAKVEQLDGQSSYLLHSTDTYQAAAQKLLGASAMNRTKITINTAAVDAALEKQFPELAAVTIKLPLLGHRPIVYLTPTRPAVTLKTLSGGAFVLDGTGRALGGSLAAANASGLPVVVDESGAPVSIGKPALAGSTVAFIQSINFQLQQKHIGVSSFTLPADTGELDLYPADAHYFVKFNLIDASTATQQIGTFLAVRHYLAGQGTAPAQYVDVRIDGRAYYK